MTLVSDLPDAPLRSEGFSAADAEAFMDALSTFVTEMNGLKSYVDARSEDASAVTLWVSGSDYEEGDPRVSPADKKTYRAKSAIINSTTDPASDPTNWEAAGGVSTADQAKLDLITITEAANLNEMASKRRRVLDGEGTAGELAVRQSDGTVTAVAESAQSLSVGDDVVFNAGTSYPRPWSIAHDPDNNKMLLVYQDVANSNYGTAVVLTVSGDTVTAGTPVVFESASTNYVSCAYDPVIDKFVVAYQDVGNSSYLTVIVGTISGTSVSFGTPDSTAVACLSTSLSFDTANSKMVVSFLRSSDTEMQAAVITVSGTTPTINTVAAITTTFGTHFGSAFDETSGKHLCITGGGSNIFANVGTVSGTSISYGANQNQVATDGHLESGDFAHSTGGKYLLAYEDGGDSSHGYVVVLTLSGSTVTAGTPVKFEAAGVVIFGVEYDPEDDAFFVIYKDVGNSNYLTYCRVTVSGTTPTPGTPVVLRSADASIYCGTGYDTTSGAIVCAFRDGSNSNYGTAFAIQPAGTATNVADWTGYFLESGVDEDSVEISGPGDIIGGFTGLTYDAEYYPEDDGSPTITPNAYGKIGRAISTTEILQTGPAV